LIDKFTSKKTKGFAGMKMPRSPNAMRKNVPKKETKKVKVILESLQGITMATYLRHKEQSKVTKCWCVIHESKFYSFKTKGLNERCEMCLDLSQSDVEITDKVGFEFKVNCDGKDHVFSAQDRYDFSRWIRELLPGNDVIVPNVALSSALRGTTESFCLDDGVRKSLEDLVDLRSEQNADSTTPSPQNGSILRKLTHGTPSPLKRFDHDDYRRSTGHLLGDAKLSPLSELPRHKKSKDDTYSAEIIKAIHSSPIIETTSEHNLAPEPAVLDEADLLNDAKSNVIGSPVQKTELEFAKDSKGYSSSEEIITPSYQNTLASAVPVLHSSPVTLKTDNLDLSAPGTESPVPSEAMAYSAASEGSSDDDLDIVTGTGGLDSSNASSWMNSSSLSNCSRFSDATVDIYNEHSRLEAELSEEWHRERRSGSFETPLRRNIPAAVLKRHFSDNNLKKELVGTTIDKEHEGVSTFSFRLLKPLPTRGYRQLIQLH
jgi:hypothetical protein